ncbi:RNA polymerase sigma factor [Sphingobacterium bovistauri]|uniref:Sigma-70 family RNA polymerase sigma factor n=1 Tax=Sphingobacterium bovistauri TaxID=2781959 RepID=A0ABS7Z0E6_9SPHI|nr:sigma-70 family RNA polymerase sigma factor [Sphingobacterium bovistauri]MCA5003638.1 sigma-70 family RNA polymerase sigma factor [Sphingobacterium bovistauri]
MEGINQHIFLKLLSKKDNQAYKLMYSQYFVALKNVSLNYVKDTDVAYDIVQDVFMSILESNKKFESIDQVKYFLFASLKNKCISHLRKVNVRNKAEEPLKIHFEILENYWEEVFEEDIYSQLAAAIHTLPPQCKLVMQYTLEGLKISEIAQKMQISTDTVKEHKSNGKKKLLKWFKDAEMLALIYFLLI